MQIALAIAAGIAVLTGVIHSVLGERLIFKHLRNGTLIPALATPPLRSSHIRILWATWHLATVFGWAFAAVLFRLAVNSQAPLISVVADATVAAYGGGALLVLVGTRGRHPGWIALGAVAVLTWYAIGNF